MKTISSVVETYIKNKPFLLNGLTLGIVNLTSLARIMQQELEQEMGKEVKQGAIVMALKRLSEELEFRLNHKVERVLKNLGDITVRSSLTDYNFTINPKVLQRQAEFISEISNLTDIFYTSSRGVNETNIIVSDSVSHLMEKHFADEKWIHKVDKLASVTVKLPKDNVGVSGLFYYVFQKLAWEGINICEVISTNFEFTIVVSEEQVDLAFKIIKDLKNL
ncbi:aspartate kinase [Flavobacterium sp. SM15]|uniref:aspartate kinase n=1 Tax=Flavobacterium sp. SM15 TaxID=2908005 RepID=UPI001EDC4BED|nr:aspartate kinase [Flavobacterium sp. SM15]MCG2610250.1 aspartate kinase [Flavobacterium sp. SM15]